MPTFHILKKGEVVEKMEGADKNRLKELIEKHK